MRSRLMMMAWVAVHTPVFADDAAAAEGPSTLSDGNEPPTSVSKSNESGETPTNESGVSVAPFDEGDSIPLKQPTPQEEPAPSVPKSPQQSAEVAAPAQSAAQPSSPGNRPGAGGDRPDEEASNHTESPQFAYFGIGPMAINFGGVEESGFALATGGRFPFHPRMAVNAGGSWGLTSFYRTREWWDEAQRIGSWTTQAYRDVGRWVSEGDGDEGWRAIAAFYAYIALLAPYAVSGFLYAFGPFASTSTLDFHMEATFHLLETRKGPYVGAGLGAAAIIFPIDDDVRAAIGPSVNLGYDFGWLGLEARAFYSPPYLHGEPGADRTNVLTGQFLFRLQGR